MAEWRLSKLFWSFLSNTAMACSSFMIYLKTMARKVCNLKMDSKKLGIQHEIKLSSFPHSDSELHYNPSNIFCTDLDAVTEAL